MMRHTFITYYHHFLTWRTKQLPAQSCLRFCYHIRECCESLQFGYIVVWVCTALSPGGIVSRLHANNSYIPRYFSSPMWLEHILLELWIMGQFDLMSWVYGNNITHQYNKLEVFNHWTQWIGLTHYNKLTVLYHHNILPVLRSVCAVVDVQK